MCPARGARLTVVETRSRVFRKRSAVVGMKIFLPQRAQSLAQSTQRKCDNIRRSHPGRTFHTGLQTTPRGGVSSMAGEPVEPQTTPILLQISNLRINQKKISKKVCNNQNTLVSLPHELNNFDF